MEETFRVLKEPPCISNVFASSPLFHLYDPVVSGSNPSLAKLSLRVRRAVSSLHFQALGPGGVVTSRGRTWIHL